MFYSFWLELKRFIEAILGKQSIESWMETINKSMREIIQDAKQTENLDYYRGICTVEYEPGCDIAAQIQLLFRTSDGKVEQMEMQRKFSKRTFCSEALSSLASKNGVVFPIEFAAENK